VRPSGCGPATSREFDRAGRSPTVDVAEGWLPCLQYDGRMTRCRTAAGILPFVLLLAAAGCGSCRESPRGGVEPDGRGAASGADAAGTPWREERRAPASTGSPPRTTPAPLGSFVGRRARLVWVQDHGDGTDTFARGDRLRLMALDTHDGRGERPVVDVLDNYTKPLVTPAGDRIVYSSRRTGEAFVVGWDGTGRRRLARGFALDVWRDPESDIEWAYIGEGDPRADDPAYAPIRRVRIDRPDVSEVVWTAPPASENHFQLSRDGRRAGGQFPWPFCGVADLAARRWTRMGDGCWTSIAPDDSYRLWIFDGAHRSLTIVDGEERWVVPVNTAPGVEGLEVYHPRWSSDVRFFVVTGPYRVGAGGNRIRGGGEGVEIFVGRFDQGLRAVDWARATRNDRADFFPDLWVEPDEEPPGAGGAGAASARRDEGGAAWPFERRGLVYVWENKAAANEVAGPDGPVAWRTEPRGLARYGRFLEMRPAGGHFTVEGLGPALGRAVGQARALAVEMLVTPENVAQEAPIVTIGADGRPVLQVWQAGRSLAVVAGERRVPAGEVRLEGGHAVHVAVGLAGDRLSLFAGGRPVLVRTSFDEAVEPGTPLDVRLGGAGPDGASWAGCLEAVAIWNRPLEAAEVARRAETLRARVAARRPIEPLVVVAEPVEPAPVPAPREILPYRRALVVTKYRVLEVVKGRYESETIEAAHWAILDGRVLPGAVRRPGARFRLVLEPYDAHPELEGERLTFGSGAMPIDLYYDVSS
jgi:hypothetical protein